MHQNSIDFGNNTYKFLSNDIADTWFRFPFARNLDGTFIERVGPPGGLNSLILTGEIELG